jgi:hypothetical protein
VKRALEELEKQTEENALLRTMYHLKDSFDCFDQRVETIRKNQRDADAHLAKLDASLVEIRENKEQCLSFMNTSVKKMLGDAMKKLEIEMRLHVEQQMTSLKMVCKNNRTTRSHSHGIASAGAKCRSGDEQAKPHRPFRTPGETRTN